MGKSINSYCEHTGWQIEFILCMDDLIMVTYKFCVFRADLKSKMAARAEYSLTYNPIEKHTNSFCQNTIWRIEFILGMDDHIMDPNKFCVFCADLKSKMAAAAEHSLT